MQDSQNWVRRIMPRPFDWVSSIFYLSALAVHFYFRARAICDFCFGGLPGALIVTVAIGLLLTIDRVEYWRFGERPAKPVASAFLILRAALIVLISIIDEFNFSMFLYILLPFMAFPVFGSRGSYAVAALAWLVYLQKILSYPGWAQDEHEIVFYIVYSAGIIFMVLMAHVVSSEQASRAKAEELLRDLQTSHRQLRAYAARVAELAATEERNRLARDIHDSLGHYLTVINVQLEKAQAFRLRNPAEADQAVADAKRLASEALQDIRSSVGALRETQASFSLRKALTKLVNDAAGERFMVELQVEGEEAGFSRQTLLALYRAAQEGLTNVRKHAQASHAGLQVRLDSQSAILCLEDNGVGFDVEKLHDFDAITNGGFGLRGVRERLELIHGELRLASRPGSGATLTVIAPKNPLALADATPDANLQEGVTNRG